MEHITSFVHGTNIMHLYLNKNNFISFLNVCDIHEADLKDALTSVKNFKNNLNITSLLFITTSVLVGYGFIFNLLLLELVLILMRFSFECGKQHLINYKYIGTTKPYTLISAWKL